MAVRNGNRYAPPLRASPVMPEQRKWMAVGPANALELEGTVSPERSFAIMLDAVIAVTHLAALAADTQAHVWQTASVSLDLAVRVTRPLSLAADTAIRSTATVAAEFDAATRVTRLGLLMSDLRQDIGHPGSLDLEATQRIYAVLRREDHLILT